MNLSFWVLRFYYIHSQAAHWKAIHDRSCKLAAKVFLWSFYDEAVEQNDQHLTADSSIRQVAFDKNAAQSIQVQFWPMPDISRHRHSNSMFCRHWLHGGYLSAKWVSHQLSGSLGLKEKSEMMFEIVLAQLHLFSLWPLNANSILSYQSCMSTWWPSSVCKDAHVDMHTATYRGSSSVPEWPF